MGKYDFDPTKTSAAGIPVLEKDSYLFEIGEPKSFARTNQKGEPSYGVMFPLKVVEGPSAGKKVFFNTYMQSDGGRAAMKRFVMTALGYNPRDKEKDFDAAYGGADWSIDPDNNKAVGALYHELTGKMIIGELDVKVGMDDKPQQDWKNWLVYGQ